VDHQPLGRHPHPAGAQELSQRVVIHGLEAIRAA
jgi:hypothetical protein